MARRRRRGDAAKHCIIKRFGCRKPGPRCEQRDRDRHAEENFREPGVGARNSRRKKKQDRQASEHALKNHGSERRDTEPFHPAARIGNPQPRGEKNREKAHRARNQPVSVLVEDAADPLRRRERKHVPAVRRRPIRHRQTGTGARDEAAGEEQEDCGSDDELGETVKHADLGRKGRIGGTGRKEWNRKNLSSRCTPSRPSSPSRLSCPRVSSSGPRVPSS